MMPYCFLKNPRKIYQGILITSDTEKKLELLNALKNSFINNFLKAHLIKN